MDDIIGFKSVVGSWVVPAAVATISAAPASSGVVEAVARAASTNDVIARAIIERLKNAGYWLVPVQRTEFQRELHAVAAGSRATLIEHLEGRDRERRER